MVDQRSKGLKLEGWMRLRASKLMLDPRDQKYLMDRRVHGSAPGAMPVDTVLWCPTLSHRYFGTSYVEGVGDHRILIPLDKMLRIARGTFPLDGLLISSKLRELLFRHIWIWPSDLINL
jgi:hypothetical protein